MIEWNNNDAALLREFNERNKSKLAAWLKTQIPKITAKSFEEVALQANKAQGASDIIEKLEHAATHIFERAPIEEHPDVTIGIE